MRYYIDCEFDGFRGPLISMALVREDGRSLHFIIEGAEAAARDPWVIENVLPILRDCPETPVLLPRSQAAMGIDYFLSGDPNPTIIADWPADIVHFGTLIETEGGRMIDVPGLRLEVKRVDAYPSLLDSAVQHNAWWDAVSLQARIEADEEAEARAAFAR